MAGDSVCPAISADGTAVSFSSTSEGLVGEPTWSGYDIFVRRFPSGQITCASLTPAGGPANWPSESSSLSGDGRYVAFDSYASNLVVGDTNGVPDVFVRDLESAETTLVSRSWSGAQANNYSMNPVYSDDGQRVLFVSSATTWFRARTTTARWTSSFGTWPPEPWNASACPPTSNNRRWRRLGHSGVARLAVRRVRLVVIEPGSGDTNLASDIFLRDRDGRVDDRVSVDIANGDSNNFSQMPSVSVDGRFVAFESWASDLVEGDTKCASPCLCGSRSARRPA